MARQRARSLPAVRLRSVGAGSVFNPADYGTLLFGGYAEGHCYSDAGTTLISADGTACQQFNDHLSGSNRHLSAGTKPAYKTGRINGQASLLFDGVDDVMQTANNGFASSGSPATTSTVFVVLKQVAWTSGARVYAGRNNGVDTQNWGVRQITSEPNIQVLGAGAGPATTALTTGSWGLVTAVNNGASSTIAVNGGAATTGDDGGAAFNALTLGAGRDGASQFANVEVAALLVYSGVLSAGNLAAVKAGLNARFALY